LTFTPSWKTPSCEFLAQAFLSLETEEEVYSFLDDLCTIAEIKAMVQRIHIARLLDKDATYTDIAAQTGASTATISRVNRCLNYGAGGYKTVLARMKEGSNNE